MIFNNSAGEGIKQEVVKFLQDEDFNASGQLEGYILFWANRANKLINTMLHPNPYLYTSTTLDLTDSQNYITLPSDYDLFASAPMCNGIELQPASVADMWSWDPAPQTEQTYPTHYDIVGDKMYIWPVPSATEEDAVTLPYYKIPDDMSGTDGDTTDTPEGIPAKFHFVIVDAVIHMGLLWLNEKDIKDSDIVPKLQGTIDLIQKHIDANSHKSLKIRPRF